MIPIKKIINVIVSIIWHLLYGIWTIITILPKYLIYGFLVIIGRKNKTKIKINKSFVSIIMLILSLATYLACVFYITRWYVQTERVKVLSKWIIQDTEILSLDESSKLDDGSDIAANVTDNNGSSYISGSNFKNADISGQKKINSDAVAWIWVNGTNISSSVVQTHDNSYYLSHDFYKNDYFSGWIYGDYRDNFETFGRNTIIYGHNSLNGKMFSPLNNLLENGWFDNKDNQYIRLSTTNSNTVWQIFSVYTIQPEIYYLTTGFTDETYQTFIDTIASRTIYNFGVNIGINDKILTLQTCTNAGDKRIVVHAKLIRIKYK